MDVECSGVAPLLDATCAPADINYPKDLKLLNQARERTEKIIAELYEQKINESLV